MMKTLKTTERLPLIEGLNESLKAELLEEAMLIELKNGSVLFSQGEPAEGLYIVLSGVIKLIRENENGVTAFESVSANKMIGVALMHEGMVLPYPASAVSKGESEVLRIPREIFLRSWINRLLP